MVLQNFHTYTRGLPYRGAPQDITFSGDSFMAEYTVKFDKNLVNRLQSSSDASVLPRPAVDCVNLNNCPGNNTHIQGRASVTYNLRENCVPKGIGLQGSAKGLVALSESGGSINALSGSFLSPSMYKLALYTTRGLPFTENPNDNVNVGNWFAVDNIRDALGAPNTVTIKRLGTDISLYQDQRIVGTLQLPSADRVFDVCNEFIGWRVQTSASVFGFDQSSCKPSLLWNGSVNMFISNYLYGTARLGLLGPLAVPVWDQAANDLFGVGVGPIIVTPPSSSLGNILAPMSVANGCDDFPGAADNAWLAFLNRDITLGTIT